ncbi:MAG: CAP domain-containing protein [Planctomycetia bacterium]|nr:CAP domain-containing protein [Planctomycetia bacterium]
MHSKIRTRVCILALFCLTAALPAVNAARFGRRGARYTTPPAVRSNDPSSNAASERTPATNKNLVSSKSKSVSQASASAQYELFGADFSTIYNHFPDGEKEALSFCDAQHDPDFYGILAKRHPDVRPEVIQTMADVARAIHQEKDQKEIGQIVRAMPISPAQLKAHEVLALNEEISLAIDREEARAIEGLNRFRMRSGLRPCIIDILLVFASRGHSNDMRRHGFFSHNSPIGGKGSFTMRARQHGASASAENIYMGSSNGMAANSAWINSSGHRANMLGGFSRVGVGRSGGHFTQMFGR